MSMATLVWKARNEMNPLGCLFHKKTSLKNTRSASSNNLCQPVPGYLEVAANKLAQCWNYMGLKNAKNVREAKTCAQEWFKQHGKYLVN